MSTISTVIFDLSEVLIAGLLGVEKELAPRLQLPPEAILQALGGERLHELCCGRLSEEMYLAMILEGWQWRIGGEELKGLIRGNFHQLVPGMQDLLGEMAGRYHLVLLSDHALEWVAYIEGIHPFLNTFQHRFFSYQLQGTKREPATFLKLLTAIDRQPEECLLIDDSAANIAAAGAAGISGIQFMGSEKLVRALKEGGML